MLISLSGEALKCQFCESRVSFGDCNKRVKQAECVKEFALDRCMKIHIKVTRSVNEEKYMRKCASAAECDKPICKEAGEDKCEVHCCTSDNCNKSSEKTVNGTTIFMCAVLAFLIKFIA